MSEEVKVSRSWDFHKKFDSYEKADSARKKLLKKKNMDVRIRRRGDGNFDIKTRSAKE